MSIAAGLIPVASASHLEQEAEKQRQVEAEARQNSSVIQSLAAHARKRWEINRDHKQSAGTEDRLLQCVRQRRGEYDPEVLALIKQQGGSEIFMNLTSVKCRAATAWLRDTMLGTGADKPWKLEPTPIPDLPPDVMARFRQQAMDAIDQSIAMTGIVPSREEAVALIASMYEETQAQIAEEARLRVDRMETKVEDQLVEGGFIKAFSEFLDDLATFPTATMKGPVPRKRRKLVWAPAGGLVAQDAIVDEYERCDPFMLYPAPYANSPHEGPFVERHKLTKPDVEAMIGVEGYDEEAIRKVLRDWDSLKTSDWLWVDQAKADAEGRGTTSTQSEDVIEALQLWDDVQGSMLVEWGMDAAEVPDPEKTYPCEVWLIGSVVIKATLNYDPLGRRPYYATSYEKIPGAYWGNGVCDLVRDPQSMCNASARALSNNMGIASGPQVGFNVSRLPAGEDLTQMYPWKIWQFKAGEFNDGTQPLNFFQPQSNAAELMAVFEKFSTLADEYSGIPRYMQGEHTPGVGRTSSGLAAMINNASKALKQVISNVDVDVMEPLLQVRYQRNLRYSDDPDLIGDVQIVAKGAMSLVAKEAAAVRRNEFLQVVLNSPVAQQVVGLPGTAELLREAAKLLDLNTDRIVPSRQQIEEIVQQQQMMAMMQAQPTVDQVEFQRDQEGAVTGASVKRPRAALPDGSPAGGRDHNYTASRA